MELEASCSCGKVSFKSTENPVIQLCCHCSDCQDALRSEYATIAFFRMDSTEVFGILEEKEYRADSGSRTVREFCSSCGAVMFDKSEGFPKLIGVMTQQMSAPFEATPKCHVWVKNKSPNVYIPSDMRQYEKAIE
jgi:hypothetical protein